MRRRPASYTWRSRLAIICRTDSGGPCRKVAGSVAPPARDELAVFLEVLAEHEDLEAVLARLECAHGRRRDTDRVELGDIDDLVVQPHTTAPRENDIDLLGLLVAMAELLALAGAQPLMAQSELRCLEIGAGEAGLAL